MRILLIIACLANVAFAFGSLPWLPNPMANHFSLNGTPNRFEPPLINAVAMCVITGFIVFMVRCFSKLSTSIYSIPNRDYWLSEYNRPKMIRRLRSFWDSLGFGANLLLLFFQWEMLQANQTIPPHATPFALVYACTALFVFIVVEIIRLYLSFRLPKTETQ